MPPASSRSDTLPLHRVRLETKTCSCSLAASISSVPFAMAEERVLIVASVSQALGELRATIEAMWHEALGGMAAAMDEEQEG